MAAYLTLAEYLARFGEAEARRLTSEAPNAATYDQGKIDTAISDAQQTVESYVGDRYTVPIANPPLIVRGWTAALARETLYTNTGKVTDAVKLAADRARQQLRDVANGTAALPIAEGAPPLATTGGLARSSMDRPRPVVSPFLDSFTGCLGGYAEDRFRTGGW